MKPTTPRGRLSAALLLAFSATLLPIGATWVAPAHAQTRPAAAPVIEGLEVNADAGLTPGSTLEFVVRGTPRSTARVQVTGSTVSVPLTETEPGIYTGSHTVRKSEKGLDPTALIRAQITRSGRTVSSNFSFPSSFAMLHANTPKTAQASGPRVHHFVLAPVERVEPGAELKFTLEGTPGAKVTIQVPGLAKPLPMQEERPGRYIANYTVRKADAVGAGPVVATLRHGTQTVTSSLPTPLPVVARSQAPVPGALPAPATSPQPQMGGAPGGPLTLQVLGPGPNAQIDSSQFVLQGRTAPGANVRIKVDAVAPAAQGRLSVAQPVTEQTVQADANGNFSLNFGPQRYAPGTRFEVHLSARHGAQATAEQRLTLFQRQG